MKTSRYILLAALLISTAASVSAVPEIPHHVYGDITDTDGPVNDINVSFYHDGSVVSSTLTDSTGYYDIKIPYDSNYDGETLDVYTEDINTGKDVTFNQGSSDKVDYEGRNIVKEDFTVSGTVTENDNAVSDTSIDIYNDGSSISSTSTDSNGDYSTSISFDDGYDNETLTLFVDGNDTGKTTTFETRGSATLDHSTSADNNNEDENNDEEDDSGGGTGSGTTDDDDDDSNLDSQLGKDDTEEANIEVTDISSAPQNPETGETVTFYVTVTNSGGTAGDKDISLTIGDNELQQTVEDLSAGETEVVEFRETFDSEQTYSASIGDQSLDVSVSAASQTEEGPEEEVDEGGGIGFIQIIGIVGVLMLIGVVGYLFIDSRSASEMEEEKKGALEAFKESKEKNKDKEGFGWNYADEED